MYWKQFLAISYASSFRNGLQLTSLVLIEKPLLLLLLSAVRIVLSERGFVQFTSIPVRIYPIIWSCEFSWQRFRSFRAPCGLLAFLFFYIFLRKRLFFFVPHVFPAFNFLSLSVTSWLRLSAWTGADFSGSSLSHQLSLSLSTAPVFSYQSDVSVLFTDFLLDALDKMDPLWTCWYYH